MVHNWWYLLLEKIMLMKVRLTVEANRMMIIEMVVVEVV